MKLERILFSDFGSTTTLVFIAHSILKDIVVPFIVTAEL